MKTLFTAFLIVLFYCCAGILMPSCNIINPAEKIPSYIQIDSAEVNIEFASQGTASHRITDAWVYVNNSLQGVYEMPMTFPLLESGTKEIIVAGGVLQNGVAGTRIAYPFFYPDTFIVNLKEKETYHIKPNFKYKPGTWFRMNEDFEATNYFNKVAGDTTIIRINNATVFEGAWCGYLKLDEGFSGAECVSSDVYSFTNDGSPVYIEMNYKCNQKFEIGLLATTNGSSIKFYNWNITPKENWSKIYLNLTEILQSIIPDDYNILIRASKDTTVTTGEIYFDNIKLLTLH